MTFTAYEIRRGAYYDSVVLMQLQRSLIELPGVLDAGVVMGTPANLELLSQSKLIPEDLETTSAEDLLIVVRTDDPDQAKSALKQVDDLISRRRSTEGSDFNPKSLDAAVKMLPDARWVLISVPGRYAARVARDALRLNRHVFLYSDNVQIEDEIGLKKEAVDKGLMVMGPDCGTAIIQGIGLGFANRVRHGNIGLVGASGTGLQAITSKIHSLGGGISHAIGTGGRDLKKSVGGITARQAIEFLARDPETKVIVLVSKPPDPEVAIQLLEAAQRSAKPVVVQFMGYAPPCLEMGNVSFALNFDAAAERAVGLLQGDPDDGEAQGAGRNSNTVPRFLRGLFSGGSLANEALRMLGVRVAPLYSNIPIEESQRLEDSLQSQAHTILDLGEDEFTVGRLHPMMDNELRIRLMQQEAEDPEVAIILLDVVLGEGAHPDPAGELSPVIADLRKDSQVEFVVILVGTEDDPQDVEAQQYQLEEAGAKVFHSTLDAITYIAPQIGSVELPEFPALNLGGFKGDMSVINVGLESFYDSLIAQGAHAVHVDWRPPAGGNEKLQSILDKMRT